MWRRKAYWPFMVRVSLDLTGCARHTPRKELNKLVDNCYRHTGRGEGGSGIQENTVFSGFRNDSLAHCGQEYSFSSIFYSLANSDPASYLVLFWL